MLLSFESEFGANFDTSEEAMVLATFAEIPVHVEMTWQRLK
jgi:hypothetical protein